MQDALLGVQPDENIAKQLRLSRWQVAHRRRKLGKAVNRPEYRLWSPWKPEEIAMLGRYPDRKIAELTGRKLVNVCRKRLKLGIGFVNPDFRPWTRAEDKLQISLIGTISDAQLARQLGCGLHVISLMRKKLKLRPYSGPKLSARTWPTDQIRLLGKMPDEKVAQQVGRTVMAVKERRQLLHIPKFDRERPIWTPREEKLLGTKSDAEIARRLNRSASAVAHRRIRLKIPAFR